MATMCYFLVGYSMEAAEKAISNSGMFVCKAVHHRMVYYVDVKKCKRCPIREGCCYVPVGQKNKDNITKNFTKSL
jgi:hypothetical protein